MAASREVMHGCKLKREIAAKLKAQGWRLELTTKGHVKAFPPNGGNFVLMGGSMDWRAVKNTTARLRRAGAQL